MTNDKELATVKVSLMGEIMNKEKRFIVTGMSCAACSARVERAVGGLPSVESCSVNLLTGDMAVVGEATDDEIISAVEKAGYGAALKDCNQDKVAKEAQNANNDSQKAALYQMIARLVASILLLLPLFQYCLPGCPCLPG